MIFSERKTFLIPEFFCSLEKHFFLKKNILKNRDIFSKKINIFSEEEHFFQKKNILKKKHFFKKINIFSEGKHFFQNKNNFKKETFLPRK